MATRKRKAYHPCEYLLDYLEAVNITREEFAAKTKIELNTLNDLLNGKISISEEIATKLARFIGTSATIWINLQNGYDNYIKTSQN